MFGLENLPADRREIACPNAAGRFIICGTVHLRSPQMIAWTLPPLIGLMAAVPAAADSWMPPQKLEAKSPNGRFVAGTTPAKTRERSPKEPPAPGQLAVYREPGGEKVWDATLSNKVSPTQLRLSDDGEYVVTLDNWFGAGYGDDVLAFYRRGEQVQRFSLEQILGVEKIDFADPLVSFSTSSRHWRETSIDFIDAPDQKGGGGPGYVIWLGKADRWLAWDMSTGRPLAGTEPRRRRWASLARTRALDMLNREGDAQTGIAFLAKLRRPEDRARIVEQLTSGSFSGGFGHEVDAQHKTERTEFFASSWAREAADKALAQWDNVPWNEQGVRLATVHGTVELPFEPNHDTTLHVHLVPENVARAAWADSKLLLHAGGQFSEHGPTTIHKKIDFAFNQVTPGRYWVKIVLDVAEPHGGEFAAYRGEKGDYETESNAIEAKAGAKAEVGTLRCDRPVK
jgi:hypothetical protein